MTNATMSDEEAWNPKSYGINQDGCCDCPGLPCEKCSGCHPPQINREGYRSCKKEAKGGSQWWHYLFTSTEGATQLTPRGTRTRGQSQTGRIFCCDCAKWWDKHNGGKVCYPAIDPSILGQGNQAAQSSGGQGNQAEQTSTGQSTWTTPQASTRQQQQQVANTSPHSSPQILTSPPPAAQQLVNQAPPPWGYPGLRDTIQRVEQNVEAISKSTSAAVDMENPLYYQVDRTNRLLVDIKQGLFAVSTTLKDNAERSKFNGHQDAMQHIVTILGQVAEQDKAHQQTMQGQATTQLQVLKEIVEHDKLQSEITRQQLERLHNEALKITQVLQDIPQREDPVIGCCDPDLDQPGMTAQVEALKLIAETLGRIEQNQRRNENVLGQVMTQNFEVVQSMTRRIDRVDDNMKILNTNMHGAFGLLRQDLATLQESSRGLGNSKLSS